MPSQIITLGGQQVAVHLRRLRGARRITLRLSAARDSVMLTLPPRASLARAMEFVQSKAGWILSHLEPGPITLAEGAVIPVLGAPHVIRRLPGRGVAHLAEGELRVYGGEAFTARRVRDFLQSHLLAFIRPQADELAARLGKKLRTVRLRDTKARWGSCTTDGNLTFQWRLAFAPEDVARYLVAHEVAHLAEMNHSPRFWRVVEEFCPNHGEAKRWLRRHGHVLHRYR